jgi:hypothetical protein
MKFSSTILLVGLCGFAAAFLMASTENPAVGTWKLNVPASKSSTGSLPKSATRTVEAQGNGVSISYEFVEPDGSIDKYSYVTGFDDQDAPISGSGTSNWRQRICGAESVAARRVGSNVFAEALKKSGNVVMTTRAVVSKKGAVTTMTASGLDSKGQPTKDVLVWDKQ